MADNTICPGCGVNISSGNSDGRKFCPNCGYKLIETVENKVDKKVTFFGAVKSFFKGYVNFKGRSSRREYWYMYLANALIMTILYVMMMPAIVGFSTYSEPSVLSIILMFVAYLFLLIYCLGTLVPWISLTVRRLHDAGFNGLLALLMLVPCIGSVAIFVFALFDSQPGDNAYGPNSQNK